VGAFGTKLRFYAAAKNENRAIDLPASLSDPRGFSDMILLNRWNSGVQEEEGANLLKQSVAEIIARIYLSDAY